MIRVFIFLYLLGSILNAKEYVVPLFDTNSSSGIWQMVGVTGLKNVSAESQDTLSDESSDSSVDNPTIPSEDGSETSSTTDSTTSTTPYSESGVSEDEMEISNIFDINLSNTLFDSLNESGSLTMYSYNPISPVNKWLYYNSRNSPDTNEFTTLQKGLGYWARYNDESLNFSSNSEKLSNAGFIFDDSFQIGIKTFTGKIFEGWNLISLPEKRTVENIYLITIEYDSTRDYNLSISKKSSLDIKKVNIDNNSTEEAIKELNSALYDLDIFVVESGVDSFGSSITLFSRNSFALKDESGLTHLLYPQKSSSSSSEKVYSQSLNGLVVDFNRDLIKQLSSLSISLNGESIDISDFSPNKLSTSEKSVAGVEFVAKEGNRTLLLSDIDISLQNNNYIKRYRNSTSSLPDNFLSIDDNLSIFQLSSFRGDINLSLTSLQNSEDYSIVRGYSAITDFVSDLQISEGEISFSNYMSGINYIETYQYPREDNLKYFLSQIFDGYIPSQLITLKTEADEDGIKWESMPISKDITDWKSFSSIYDPVFSIDKRRAYWVKFIPTNPINSDFSIDEEQSTLDREVFHQVSSDSRYINNVTHYTIQIFLKDVSKSTRGYITIGDSEIELKPELDGTVFISQLDYEDLYQISNLDTLEGVEAIIVDENGIENSLPLDINFSQPDKPSSLITFDDIFSDDSLRLFRGDLKYFDEVTDLNKDLCSDFGTQTVYVVKSDKSDSEISLDELILSNPLKKSYFSKYKGTSRLDTKVDGYSDTPINYTETCEESRDVAEYEGVRIGASDENLSIFYKKSSSFLSDTPDFPDVMYIKVNGKVIKLDFDSSYRGASFYVLDSDEVVYSGKFIPDTYNSIQTPYSLQIVE